MADLLVPGQSKVWVSKAHTSTNDPTTWAALPHTVSWSFSANVEEATEIRTSDTDNRKVPACGGATSYEATLTSALCDTDWLYAYILEDETDPTTGPNLWFYCIHEPESVPAAITNDSVDPADLGSLRGPVFRGLVQAPGFEMDNDASDPTVVEWTVKIQEGPYLPKASGTGATRPLDTLQ